MSTSSTTIRILLVDDHPLVLEGLVARLDAVPHFQVVGEAGDALQGLALAAELKPDLVLTDIGMREVNGIELIRRLMARATPAEPAPIVLVLSMYDDPEYARQALAAGARAYVLKDSPSTEIIAAINTVFAGGTYISPAMAQRLFRPVPARVELSERETQILGLIGQGQSSKQIARTLEISVRTVETHRLNLHRKLDLSGQADLIRYAVEHGRQLPR